ncbi:hypothetical protein DICVIV_02967 [Dictyocaulus viviparus]|uniref:Uncharacterized protein n=1 Tax=Dictyocaulus viviparus TaxID=29172 RepID=A0A0D8Y3R6_DICVI|nr:hypothetical protein DICVIV_02967 [Dictyocaulus viviparus]
MSSKRQNHLRHLQKVLSLRHIVYCILYAFHFLLYDLYKSDNSVNSDFFFRVCYCKIEVQRYCALKAVYCIITAEITTVY